MRHAPRLTCALVWVIVGLTSQSAIAQWIEQPGTGWDVLFVTAAGGLFRGVDTWIQVPFHRLIFEDNLDRRVRSGFGDLRIYLRAGPELFGLRPIPMALRAGVKFVGGDFPVDAEIIPLGEGQRDWELMLEAGTSFHPVPAYVMGWIGFVGVKSTRKRIGNRETKPLHFWLPVARSSGFNGK